MNESVKFAHLQLIMLWSLWLLATLAHLQNIDKVQRGQKKQNIWIEAMTMQCTFKHTQPKDGIHNF